MLPKVILVPIDFSAGSERALEYACALAAKLGATVRLVHAVASPPAGLQVALSESILENLVTENREALQKLAARHEGVTFGEPVVEVGDPRDTITKAASGDGPNLIVMGTHGRRGLSRLVMGSVAEDVVRHAPCPVLAVRGQQGDA